MDLRQYFRKIRETEATITTPHTFVISLETPDGGKAGQITETSRYLSAKLLVEGKGKLASREEADYSVAQQAEQRETLEAAGVAKGRHVTIVPERAGVPVKSGFPVVKR